MSVPVSKRSENKLIAGETALALCTHTLNLTKGKKFDTSQERALTDHIKNISFRRKNMSIVVIKHGKPMPKKETHTTSS